MLPVRFVQSRLSDVLPDSVNGLARWTRDLDQVFDGVFGSVVGSAFPVDVRQEGDDWLIEAELPGLHKEDIEITVENGVLTIAGEINKAKEREEAGYHVCERRYGKFSRSFKLPSSADGEQVNANLQDGILTLRIPTRAEAKPRRIAVK